jgi:hypothetical protein
MENRANDDDRGLSTMRAIAQVRGIRRQAMSRPRRAIGLATVGAFGMLNLFCV